MKTTGGRSREATTTVVFLRSGGTLTIQWITRRVLAKMRETDMTQLTLASRMGVTRHRVQQITRMMPELAEETLERLEMGLGVSRDYWTRPFRAPHMRPRPKPTTIADSLMKRANARRNKPPEAS